MGKINLAACVLAVVLCGPNLAPEAQAAPLGMIGDAGQQAGASQALTINVGYRCSRCGSCYQPRAAYGYVAPRYEPSVVYYGPSGIYRPYPPVVVYQYADPYPAYALNPPPWRYATDYYYYRRW